MDDSVVKALMIDPDLQFAWKAREMLSTGRGAPFHLECASQLATALERIEMGGIEVVLLTLSPEG